MTAPNTSVKVGAVTFSNAARLALIAGPCQLESRQHAFDMAGSLKEICDGLGIGLVYKSSYDKANRTSIGATRGAGLDAAMPVFDDLRREFGVPVLTDVHTPEQAAPVAEVCDILQLPAFLARQTDLVDAMARTGAAINIKKPQFLSPAQMANVVEKFREFGNDRLMVCERGSNFGYDNLVVDMLGFEVMSRVTTGCPLIFDVTHSLQRRDPGESASGGRRDQVLKLAKAGAAVGIAGLFLEAHPNPDEALCDGPSALPLAQLEPFLEQVKAVDALAKSQPELTIH